MENERSALIRWVPTFAATVTACLLAMAGAALADSASPLRVQLTQARVMVDAKGAETLGGAEHTKPGDLIEYRATYTNAGAASVTHLLATLPIPAGTSWIAGSAVPSGVEMSLDGKEFSSVPLRRRIQQANGISGDEPIPYSAYRVLRWTVPELAAGKSTAVTARVRVEAVQASPTVLPSLPPGNADLPAAASSTEAPKT